MINRPYFLDWLWSWKDKKMIKVVTGIRRCGKSTLFELYQAQLLASGIKPEQIISLNFEDPDVGEFQSYREVWDLLTPRLKQEGRCYIFLDEVQRVPEFEKLVDGLFAKKHTDIYITGSNAYFLSGELATFLSGRYVEIKMQPLSFREYVEAQGPGEDRETHYKNYLRYSSFPYTLSLGQDLRQIRDYLSGLYNTILLKDVMLRKGFKDTALLERVTRFLFDNIGSMTSIHKIAATLSSSGMKTTPQTIDNYVHALCDTFLLYQVKRYDIKGREYLKTNAKYYLADIGLRYFLLGGKGGDQGHILENSVFLELLRRSGNVHVGKVGEREVDFMTQEGDQITYYQVALSVRDEGVLQRELAPLQEIHDHHPKFLLTLDNDPEMSHNGIRQRYVLDFLMEEWGGGERK